MSRTILAIVDDLFFVSKIRATAEALGVEISFLRSTEKLFEKARETKPALVIVDLHHERLDPIALATELRSDEQLLEVPLLGFFSHVHAELQRSALAAGYSQVMPRSAFSRDLAKILSGD